MDLIDKFKKILLQNKLLFVILIGIGIAGAFTHYKFQKVTYITTISTTTGGFEESYKDVVFNFSTVDTTKFEVNNDIINEFKSFDIIRVNSKFQNLNVINFEFVTNKNLNKQDITRLEVLFSTLLQNNRTKKAIEEEINNPNQKELDFVIKQTELINDAILKIDSTKNELGVILLTEKSYSLNKERIKLEESIKNFGNIRLITGFSPLSPIKRPLVLFLILYLVISCSMFIIISKKN